MITGDSIVAVAEAAISMVIAEEPVHWEEAAATAAAIAGEPEH